MMAAVDSPMSSRGVHQRRTKSPIECAARSPSRTLSARGHRGEMRFFLQRVVGGLYVEREDIPRLGPQTLQSLQFMAEGAFREWCDNDPVRFEYPLLHIDLKRHGDQLWRLDAPPGDSDGV
jgi:hypothetical protein